MARTIAIGDIHGCADEFEQLLNTLELTKDDRVIQVGDLINRGPDSHRVLELARHYKIEAILGNHEHRLLMSHDQNDMSILKDYDFDTLDQLTKEDWTYIQGLGKSIYDEAHSTLFVHGGFIPHLPWKEQTLEVITTIQVLDENGNAAKRSDCPNGTPWADSWQGPEFVIYGHTPRPKILSRSHSIGIDTGCVYGGHLTAYIVEEKAIVQVQAHKTYAYSSRLPNPV
ncbi:MAG TPA: metallophosphoesterase [Opitutae bacterium]|nr:metallophosphoesterase [Opitutae bacterium]